MLILNTPHLLSAHPSFALQALMHQQHFETSISIHENAIERVKEVGLACIPELGKCEGLVKKALLVGCKERWSRGDGEGGGGPQGEHHRQPVFAPSLDCPVATCFELSVGQDLASQQEHHTTQAIVQAARSAFEYSLFFLWRKTVLDIYMQQGRPILRELKEGTFWGWEVVTCNEIYSFLLLKKKDK
jgi:hypothetical protein